MKATLASGEVRVSVVCVSWKWSKCWTSVTFGSFGGDDDGRVMPTSLGVPEKNCSSDLTVAWRHLLMIWVFFVAW